MYIYICMRRCLEGEKVVYAMCYFAVTFYAKPFHRDSSSELTRYVTPYH